MTNDNEIELSNLRKERDAMNKMELKNELIKLQVSHKETIGVLRTLVNGSLGGTIDQEALLNALTQLVMAYDMQHNLSANEHQKQHSFKFDIQATNARR
jgi:hypothetical protein